MSRPVLLGIYREHVYSPGKIQADAAVLDAVLSALSGMDFKIESCGAEFLDNSAPRPEIVLSMAQSDPVLSIMEQWSGDGSKVINSAQSIRGCYRKPLMQRLVQAGIPVPPGHLVEIDNAGADKLGGFSNRLWLKRGDVHAIQEGDVASVTSAKSFTAAMIHFVETGVRDLLVQDHIEGPVVKFYGVGQQRFFRAYLESSGEEVTSRMDSLRAVAAHAAAVIGLEVYGGDAVLTGGNGPVLIDFNDWPSFSRCCRSAGLAIAEYIGDCLESPIAFEPHAKVF
jgi:glutathione synthase/RimK-type ligase-like ATP-grasp enzyme